MDRDFDFKKIMELFPIFSAWALIYTSLGLYSYYQSFNVDIFGYIDIGELVLLSFSKFAITIIALILFFFICILHPFQDFFRESDPLDAGHKSNFKIISYPFYISLLLIILFSLIGYNKRLSNLFELIKEFCIGFVVILSPIYLSLIYIFIRKKKKQILTVIIIFLFNYSCAISFIVGQIEYNSKRKDPLGNSILFNNKIIKSTNHYYYIGQTKNYLFFYNDALKLTDIYPIKFVSKMTLK